MRNICFIVTITMLFCFLQVDANAQVDPSIIIDCPSWGTESRLPSNLTDRLLIMGDRPDGERGLALYTVDTIGVSTVNLPTPVDGNTTEYSLSPFGTRLAYFEIDSSMTLVNNLIVFNTVEHTTIQFQVEFDGPLQYEIVWLNESSLALTPTYIITGHEQNISVHLDTSTMESQPMTFPTEVEMPFVVNYAPHLNLLAFVDSDNLGIASMNGEILFSSRTFDYYNSISSVAWWDNPNEVLLYTDDWYIFSSESRELTNINAPTAYQLSHPSWSPEGRFIAFIGVRLPFDRPHRLDELIVYDRVNQSFTDFCQIGDFYVYGSVGGMRWSTDSRYFAYTLTDDRGLNLYVLDVERSIISHIEIDIAGEVPRVLGWQRGEFAQTQ